MINHTDEQLLKGFISGSLSQEQIAALSTRRAVNTELDRKLKVASAIDKPLADWQSLQIRQKLSQIHSREASGRSAFSMLFNYKKSVVASIAAASLVILIGVAISLIGDSTPDGKSLYSAYYQPAKPFLMQRSSAATASNDFVMAQQFYASKDYTAAAKILSEHTNNMAARFYLAMSLMELGDYAKASENLKLVASDQSNLFNDQAGWYLSLCYVRLEDFSAAKTVLQRISGSQSYFNDKAVELLKQLP